MYSVVLMMAMTGGGDVPAGLFHNNCNGGSCYGSCYGSGYGCCGGSKHQGHSRGHGCSGSCYGGCYGSSYGCCGGSKHHGHTSSYGCCGGGSKHGHKRSYGCCGGSCYGSSYGGCYGSSFGGCYGSGAGFGAGCIGGGVGTPVIVPAAPAIQNAPAVTPVKPAPKKTTFENAAPATLVINVPAEARLTIDGETTVATSTQRVFVSPALEIGREFHYTVKVEFVKEGKVVSVSKEVAVKAGNETRVTLDAENIAGVASR